MRCCAERKVNSLCDGWKLEDDDESYVVNDGERDDDDDEYC